MKDASLLLIALFFAFGSCTNTRNSAETAGVKSHDLVIREHKNAIAENLQKTCQNVSDFTHVTGLPLETSKLICTFYQQNEFEPVWTNGDTLTGQAVALIRLLERSREYGLEKEFYHTGILASFNDSLKELPDGDPRHASIGYTGEVLLTNAWFLFATHVAHGYIDPDSLTYRYKYDSVKADLTIALQHAIDQNKCIKTLLSFEPNHPEYKRLKEGLASFLRNYELTDNTFEITSYKDDSVAVYALGKEILVSHGFAGEDIRDDDSAYFDALKYFQEIHGLNNDGKIGRYTAYALNRSNLDRYRHAAASLEKWRWENNLGESHIFVNIAAFKLDMIEKNKIVREHRTVVGAPQTKTPTFSAELQYITVNPFWHVPYSIASKEILPNVQKDPEYLSRHGYKVFTQDRNTVDPESVDWEQYNQNNFPYRIRQNNGWGNSLGLIAFMFPNKHSVFIHDTPAKLFFKNDVRAYSHGCVRLEDPIDLAKHIVERDLNQHNADSMDSYIARHLQRRVYLNEPIPVHIRYFTTTGDSSGKIIFNKDVYGRDNALMEAMFRSKGSPVL